MQVKISYNDTNYIDFFDNVKKTYKRGGYFVLICDGRMYETKLGIIKEIKIIV